MGFIKLMNVIFTVIKFKILILEILKLIEISLQENHINLY